MGSVVVIALRAPPPERRFLRQFGRANGAVPIAPRLAITSRENWDASSWVDAKAYLLQFKILFWTESG